MDLVIRVWFCVLFCFTSLTERFESARVDNYRIDCYPEGGATEAKCKVRKCIWKARPQGASVRMPECYFDPSVNYGYNEISRRDTQNGFVVNLNRSSTLPTDVGIFTNPIQHATFTLERHSATNLRITIRDANKKRYEVPAQSKFYMPSLTNKQLAKYSVSTYNNKKSGFSFSVNRPANEGGNSIFKTTSTGAMIMSDQFLEISAKIRSANCYGFGEHEQESFFLNFNWNKLRMFSRDQPPSEGANLYGVHPFYMCLDRLTTKAHGVLFLNSNAMEITLLPSLGITFRTIGGVLDFFFFMGPTPADVIKQYTGLIGRPFMPPYWSLGFQLCRYGYNSLDVVKRTVDRMKKYDIPQDVQYGDIDYMDRQLDFTINPKTYNGLSEYVRELKKDGIRYISILDPAISANETAGQYEPYDLGNKLNIWIKDHTNGTLFGKVWPDLPNVTVDETKSWDYQVKHYRSHAAFPDFTHPDIIQYWGKLIVDFHKTIEFDGIWIDMNEPANFVVGSVNGCPVNNSLEKPPYKPGIWGKTLADKTVCMTGKHWNGEVEYNLHSLYGWSQTKPTYDATEKATGKRPLVISRSTYPSSGRYAGHWLGDNKSQWSQMKMSIVGMLQFGFFGVPYIGADICGFFEDTTEDLCQKWMALGAFYPFSRNHNTKGAKEQDPAFFGPKFAKKARDVLRIRYNLLPYLYTLFYDAHKTGAPIVRPLFYEFQHDYNSWGADEQFMWGKSLLITPILRKDQNTTISGYFPSEMWYDYYNGKLRYSAGATSFFPITNETQILLHVRGGTIMPTQDPANNTMFSRRNPMGLIIALDAGMKASGNLFWDDGDSKDSLIKNQYQMLDFTADMDSVVISLRTNGFSDAGKFNFEHMTIYGLYRSAAKQFSYITNNDVGISGAKGVLNNDGVLKITGMKLPLNKAHKIKWFTSGTITIQGNLFPIIFGLALCVVLDWLMKN